MSPVPPLLVWGARSIGPRVHRLLLAQLLLVTLVAGINWRSVEQLLGALGTDPDLRSAALASIALATLSARRAHRRALCPVSLVSLRRQPLGDAGFAVLALPWAVALAWPWMLVPWLGHPDDLVVTVAVGTLGALCVSGTAAAPAGRAILVWAPATLAPALLVDRTAIPAWPVLLLAGFPGAWLAGREIRGALADVSSGRTARRGVGDRSGTVGTPLGALLALDRHVLAAHLQWPAWLAAIPFPLAATAYAIVLGANGNCSATCPDAAAVIVFTLCAGLPVLILDTLRRVQGAHFLVPDRVVPTRVRLASLFLVASASLVPFALALAPLAREPAALPHAAAVALAALYLQLGDLSRPATLGPLAWLLLVPTSIVLLPAALRFPMSALVALGLAALVARRGKRVRADLAAGRTPGTDGS